MLGIYASNFLINPAKWKVLPLTQTFCSTVISSAIVPSLGAQVTSVLSVISVPKDVRFFESVRWRLVRRDEFVRDGRR